MGTSFVAERLQLQISSGAVDRVNGIVRGVRIIGPRSKNGRKYPGDVTAKALKLFDGASVNVGHHFDPATGLPVEVPPTAKFGRMTNPRAIAEGANGDLRFNPKHPFAEPFLWACEHDPAAYSFSVLQQVRWKPGRDDDGDLVAESILDAASVDIVSEGGTTNSVFESFNNCAQLNHPYTKESAMPDVTTLVNQFETPGAAAGFLFDLFKALSAKFSGTELNLLRPVVAQFANTPVDVSAGNKFAEAEVQRDEEETAAAESRRISKLVDDWCNGDPLVTRLVAEYGGPSPAVKRACDEWCAAHPSPTPVQPTKTIAELVAAYNPG